MDEKLNLSNLSDKNLSLKDEVFEIKEK